MHGRPLVVLARTGAARAERAAELLSELDEWFEVSASAEGAPDQGFASVDVGEHAYLLDEAARQVVERLDQIDAKWRESLRVADPEGA